MKKTSKRISLLLRKKGFFMCTTSMLLANVSVFASPDAAKTSLLPAKSDVASVAIVAQQGKTITGVVMDSQESIIGANVMVKGTTNGTITDFEGKFTDAMYLKELFCKSLISVIRVWRLKLEIKLALLSN